MTETPEATLATPSVTDQALRSPTWTLTRNEYEPLQFAVTIDAASAETFDGRTIACRAGQSYHCEDSAGIYSVTVEKGEQSWTYMPRFVNELDPSGIHQDNLKTCLPADTRVVEGELGGLDATSARVALIGMKRLLARYAEEPGGWFPARECKVEGTHYACFALGYRETVEHRLRVQAGDQIVLTEPFELPIVDCQVESVVRDISP